MPSLSDIPQNILDSTDKQLLIDWLKTLPVPFQIRQALGVFWMRHTGTRLTLPDWKIISADTNAKKILNAT